ncbi:MAG: hypothetical protein D8M58_12175 [Calditrichaeota bacterium]|nr:MAG: hypothetical protein DWQ03_12960 [Calditrichota bacterium]MBL1206153.1 hypothetical protein [Calditrichota bacterium]NOG45978.1 hypothetical protein [Calditrichota bacterium]
MQIKLYKLDRTFRHFLSAFILLLLASTFTGLAFVYQTTQFAKTGITERYSGSITSPSDDFDILEKYPKSYSEMLLNTHNHLFGFAFIFFTLGFVFYFNSVITGFWKYLLLVEPFFSVLITFSGMWAMRFIHPGFVCAVIIAGFLTYAAIFIMAFTLIYELLLKKD